MRRSLFNFVTILSLVLVVATASLWVCSNSNSKSLALWGGGPQARYHQIFLLNGTISIQTTEGVRGYDGAEFPNYVEAAETGRGWDIVGFHRHQWTNIVRTYDRKVLPGNYGKGSEFWFTLWWPFVVTLILPLYWTVRFPWKTYFHRGRNPGMCRSCGYDLTGNLSGVCPECGSKIAAG